MILDDLILGSYGVLMVLLWCVESSVGLREVEGGGPGKVFILGMSFLDCLRFSV